MSAETSADDSEKKSPVKRGCLIFFAILFGMGIVLHIPIWVDDAKALSQRKHVLEIAAIGKNLGDVQDALREQGFEFLYEEPIKPTYDESYYQQGVIVGDTSPNSFETLAYAMGAPWMPFCRSVSPYVMIDAELDGTINRIH